jgi:hypothetical protein
MRGIFVFAGAAFVIDGRCGIFRRNFERFPLEWVKMRNLVGFGAVFEQRFAGIWSERSSRCGGLACARRGK